MAAVVWRRWRAPWRCRPRPWRTGYFERARAKLIKRDSVLWSVDQKPVTEWEAEVTRLRQENTRLRVEKEIWMAPGHVEKAAAYFATVKVIIPRSRWEIRRTQAQHSGRYGRRRMTPEVIESLGRPVNPKRMGRMMRGYERGSRKRRRFRVVTTDSKHAHPVHGERFKTRADAQQAIIEYLGYDNTERRHSSLGNVSRAECERRGYDESNRVSEVSKRCATLFLIFLASIEWRPDQKPDRSRATNPDRSFARNRDTCQKIIQVVIQNHRAKVHKGCAVRKLSSGLLA